MATATTGEHDGLRTVAYFVNWAIYNRNYHPQNLPTDKLTHVIYAFAHVKQNGQVFLTDDWSDVEKRYPEDRWEEPTPGPHIYGCLKQMALLKRRNRNLKTLLSIGGWGQAENFAAATSTSYGRIRFARSALDLIGDCGFDGIDIDWEYPQNETETANLLSLVLTTRVLFNKYAAAHSTPNEKVLLTVACPAAPPNYFKLDIAEMDKYVTFWNLMAYDFSGPWNITAAHHCNIFPLTCNPQSTPFNANAAVKYYHERGVPFSKIVLGCPLYGRAFVDTLGPGDKYRGGVGEGSWEKGIWDWKALPPASATAEVSSNMESMLSWSYDQQSKTMISFDTERIVELKAQWVLKNGLGGIMWWESSGDKKVGQGSAIECVEKVFREGRGLERKENVIDYWWSKYRNMKDGFPGE